MKKTKKLSAKELSAFSLQFAMLLKAGLPLEEGVGAIKESLDNRALSEILAALEKDVAASDRLSGALKNCGCFPDYLVNMVTIGEKTGNLDTVFLELSQYYDREDKLRENVRTAVTYPMILILMVTAVLGVLVTNVMPALKKVLQSLGGELPQSSETAINAGFVIGIASFSVAVALIVIAAIIAFLWATQRGKKAVLSLAAKLPTTQKIYTKISAARFSSMMSMLISCGYQTDETLDMLVDILPGEICKSKAYNCRRAIENGDDFAEGLKKTGFFKGLHPAMIKTGVKAGSLDLVMKKIASQLDGEAETTLSNLVSFIEPVLIGFLSVVIGGVLLSNLLPLLGVISAVG